MCFFFYLCIQNKESQKETGENSWKLTRTNVFRKKFSKKTLFQRLLGEKNRGNYKMYSRTFSKISACQNTTHLNIMKFKSSHFSNTISVLNKICHPLSICLKKKLWQARLTINLHTFTNHSLTENHWINVC